MTTWSTRIGALLLPGVCAAGLVGLPAMGQVSAANTIPPENIVVGVPKPVAAPTLITAPTTVGVPKPVAAPTLIAAPMTVGVPKPFAASTLIAAPTTVGVQTTKVPKKRARSTTTTSTMLPVVAGLTEGAEQSAVSAPTPVFSPVEAQSFSDPLADLASAALGALPAGPVAGQPVAAGSVPVDAQVPTIVSPAPAVQFALTPTAVAPDPNVPRPPSTDGMSSAIINTSDLGDYVLGTAVVAPISQESQKILAALPTATAERYMALLRAMSKVVGPRTKTDPAALEAVWVRTDGRRMKAILTAMAQVGTRYHFTGNKPGGFDCSGLSSYAWSQAGVKIPRTSTLQYQGLPKKTASELLPGDIVWHPGHVSMYLGVGTAVVDAPQTGKTVLVKSASASSWVSFHSPL